MNRGWGAERRAHLSTVQVSGPEVPPVFQSKAVASPRWAKWVGKHVPHLSNAKVYHGDLAAA